MLDHNDRVTDVAKPLECSQQALIVTLVQPDRRLVKDVPQAMPLPGGCRSRILTLDRSAKPSPAAKPSHPPASQ